MNQHKSLIVEDTNMRREVWLAITVRTGLFPRHNASVYMHLPTELPVIRDRELEESWKKKDVSVVTSIVF